MIRFIDLRHVSEDINGYRFAFYNTVNGSFVSDDMGGQAWETIGQFAQGYQGTELQRFVQQVPEWAKHAVPDREVFKVEVRPATEDSIAVGHATNEDGSARCHIPLSPLVLEAMQSRPLAYFHGEQIYAIDERVGGIEGQIVINFDAEVGDQSW